MEWGRRVGLLRTQGRCNEAGDARNEEVATVRAGIWAHDPVQIGALPCPIVEIIVRVCQCLRANFRVVHNGDVRSVTEEERDRTILHLLRELQWARRVAIIKAGRGAWAIKVARNRGSCAVDVAHLIPVRRRKAAI